MSAYLGLSLLSDNRLTIISGQPSLRQGAKLAPQTPSVPVHPITHVPGAGNVPLKSSLSETAPFQQGLAPVLADQLLHGHHHA